MEQQRLTNEIKKVRDAYASLETDYSAIQEDSLNMNKDNEKLANDNKNLLEMLHKLEAASKRAQEEKNILAEINNNLSQDIEKMKEETPVLKELKADAFTLENQVIQLRLELDEITIINTQYLNENAVLNDCLVNANKQVEDKVQSIKSLKEQIPRTMNEIITLDKNIDNLKNELEQNQQNPDTIANALERNRVLTAEKREFQTNLISALELNERLQLNTCQNELQIQELEDNVDASAETTETLETIRTENLSKISALSTKIAEEEIKIEETVKTNDELNIKNNSLENQISELNYKQNNLDQSYRNAIEQLLNVMEQKVKVEKELKSFINTQQKGTIEDLKLALNGCIITTRMAIDKFNNLPGDFTNVDVDHDLDSDVYEQEIALNPIIE